MLNALLLSLMIGQMGGQDPAPPSAPAPTKAQDDELGKAGTKAVAMTNYTVKFSIVTTGAQAGGGATNAGDAMIQADSPWYIKGSDSEIYRKGDKAVYKEGDAWKEVVGVAKGEKPDKKAMTLMGLKNLKAPTDVLKDVATKIKDAKREDSDGGKCFSGDLTPEAAKELGAVQIGKKGGDGSKSPLEFTGSMKVWVNGDGAVTKYEITTTAKGKMKDRDIDIKKVQTIEISAIGTTKYEVPEEAKKAVE